jgi:predicted esterase
MRKLIMTVYCFVFLTLIPYAHAERMEIVLADSSRLGVYLLLPQNPEHLPAPLVILMPGGSGDEALARNLQYWLGEEMVERGWAVALPVSPNNRSFRADNNALIPLLITELQKHESITHSKPLLAGISNGGMSALEIVAANPQDYLGIMAVPALVPDRLDVSKLAGVQIYLRIGDQDEMSWMNRFEETKKTLEDAGAILDAGLVFMSPHMFQMEWETLDPWLSAIKATAQP